MLRQFQKLAAFELNGEAWIEVEDRSGISTLQDYFISNSNNKLFHRNKCLLSLYVVVTSWLMLELDTRKLTNLM